MRVCMCGSRVFASVIISVANMKVQRVTSKSIIQYEENMCVMLTYRE